MVFGVPATNWQQFVEGNSLKPYQEGLFHGGFGGQSLLILRKEFGKLGKTA